MTESYIKTYKSRRNRAALVGAETGQWIQKTFAREESFQKELQIYRLLEKTDLPCARVLEVRDKTLLLSRLPGKTLVDCLEAQEQAGQIQWSVWEKLVNWLGDFHRLTGFSMTDVNLRNFLYDEKKDTLYGLDFEECRQEELVIPAAAVAAFIRTYKPENTPLKQEISQYILTLFARSYGLEVEALLSQTGRQEQILLKRRKK